MARQIILKEEPPRIFYKSIERLDPDVYQTGKFAYPLLPSFTISGTGFGGDAAITVYNQETVLGKLLTSSLGTFQFQFEPDYHRTMQVRTEEDISGEVSNLIVIDCYNYLSWLYPLTLKLKQILNDIGQGKQNLYVEDRVGDTVEPRFDTEKDSYESTTDSLYDKISFSLTIKPADLKEVAKHSLLFSEKGCTVGALVEAQCIIRAVLDDQNIVIFPYHRYDHPRWYLREKFLTAKFNPATNHTDLVNVPTYMRQRYLWEVGWLGFSVEKDYLITVDDGYTWLYIDGDVETDGSYEVKVSATPVYPQVQLYTENITSSNIFTDTTGYYTGIKGQKYVALSKSALMNYSVSVTYGGVEIGAPELRSSRMLALGTAHSYNPISVSYYTYYQPLVIAIVLMEGGDIISIHRTYQQVNHTYSCTVKGIDDIEVYVAGKDNFTTTERNMIKEIILACMNVTRPKNLLVKCLEDDVITSEDWNFWSGFYKGFCHIGR